MARTGYAKGINRGHITTQRTPPVRKDASKGKITAKATMVRSLIREVTGLSPYERRILDMIKTGGSSADKRIYKYAKRRLGSHKRALAKREDIKAVNAQQRARAAKESKEQH